MEMMVDKFLFNEFFAWALNKGLDYDSGADEGDSVVNKKNSLFLIM